MDQPPFILARHRVTVAVPQIPLFAAFFEIIEALRVLLAVANVKLDRPAVSQPAIYKDLFAKSLRFKGDAWQLQVQANGGHRRQQENEQQHEPCLLRAMGPGRLVHECVL